MPFNAWRYRVLWRYRRLFGNQPYLACWPCAWGGQGTRGARADRTSGNTGAGRVASRSTAMENAASGVGMNTGDKGGCAVQRMALPGVVALSAVVWEPTLPCVPASCAGGQGTRGARADQTSGNTGAGRVASRSTAMGNAASGVGMNTGDVGGCAVQCMALPGVAPLSAVVWDPTLPRASPPPSPTSTSAARHWIRAWRVLRAGLVRGAVGERGGAGGPDIWEYRRW